MSNIIGRFYFKMTKTGNLIGEYSNSGMKEVDTESANSISENHGFIGTYRSTWSEGNKFVSATLHINYKLHTNNSIYSLEWKDTSNNVMHWGEGMLVDDLLIGDYRDFELS